MKQLLITIAAMVLVGCGPQPPDISIYVASVEGNIEAVKQHMVAGTDANSKDPKSRSGVTGLHGAAESGHVEIAELLIAEGANVNEMSKVGTPLLLAAAFGHKEILELFIAKGGDVKVIQPGDKTPLDYAAAKGHKEIADLLIAKGVNVNSKDVNGNSSIHRAVDNGYKEIVELLIAKGADVNAKGYDGNTPLDLAIEDDVAEIEIADLLRKHGGKTGAELKAEGK